MTKAQTAQAAKHPGEYLARRIAFHEISAQMLADAIGVPGNRITDIIRGRRGISADTAIRLSGYFNTTPHFWMNMQLQYDLWRAYSGFK